MDRIEIRRATVDDTPLLVDLMVAFYGESGYVCDRAWASASFGALLAAPELGCVALAHSDGAPLGYGVLTTKYSMEFGGLSASVEDLYVCAPSRGRGAGSALLAFLREDASRRGCVAMQVEVAADNAVALALYRAYGLVETGDNRLVLSGPLPVKP